MSVAPQVRVVGDLVDMYGDDGQPYRETPITESYAAVDERR